MQLRQCMGRNKAQCLRLIGGRIKKRPQSMSPYRLAHQQALAHLQDDMAARMSGDSGHIGQWKSLVGIPLIGAQWRIQIGLSVGQRQAGNLRVDTREATPHPQGPPRNRRLSHGLHHKLQLRCISVMEQEAQRQARWQLCEQLRHAGMTKRREPSQVAQPTVEPALRLHAIPAAARLGEFNLFAHAPPQQTGRLCCFFGTPLTLRHQPRPRDRALGAHLEVGIVAERREFAQMFRTGGSASRCTHMSVLMVSVLVPSLDSQAMKRAGTQGRNTEHRIVRNESAA